MKNIYWVIVALLALLSSACANSNESSSLQNRQKLSFVDDDLLLNDMGKETQFIDSAIRIAKMFPTKSTSEEKSNAQEEIQRINNEKNAIMIAENLIKTKGFEDVVLFVNNGNVTAVVKANSLDEQQVAQIQNIITRELNVKVNKINVSVKNS